MNSFIHHHIKLCPKTGRFIGFKHLTGINQLLFPFIGLAACAWIIFRVATKPSRIAYPCVRAAMPFASSLVGYFLFFGISTFAWLKARKTRAASATFFAVFFGVIGIVGPSAITSNSSPVQFQTALPRIGDSTPGQR